MTDGSDRVEFASEAWVALARAWLEDHVLPLGDVLDGVRLTICEVFTDAPPHIANDDEKRMAWYFTIDGQTVAVGTGVPEGVTPMVVADYQDVLPIARTIFSEDAEALAAMRARRREQPRTAGPPPWPRELGLVLDGLHDALARRTL